jgi:hypothetical protein
MCWICLQATAVGQRTIEVDGYQFEIDQLKTGLQNISLESSVLPGDDPVVKLYKQYFNPPSFAAYRSFFLAADWGGFTESDFNAWQSRVHNNQMILDKTMQLHDQFGNKYAICQYRMITKENEIPGNAIFKKINQDWKHISFMNDQQADGLKAIGLLDDEYLLLLPEDGSSRKLANAPASVSKAPIEKFNRNEIFQSVRKILAAKGVSSNDMTIADNLFAGKAEVEMAKYIAVQYKLDVYDLMEELNGALGFTMFKFVRTAKSQ